ncbi:MAG: S41 family peptidase, partial [Lysinibacillus sp.]
MNRSRLFLSLFVVVVAVVGFTIVREALVKPKTEEVEMSVVEEMLGLIQQHSIYKPKQDELVEGALKGMAQAIHDPYSTYYTESEAKLHEASLAEQKAGIGIELSESGGKFIIVAPMKDSPAEKAGIRPLDEIVQIDNEKLHGHSMKEVLKLLQRDVGDEIELVLYRSSIDEHLRLKVTVQQMKNKTVAARTVVVQNVVLGVITIKLFGENTTQEWIQAVEQLRQQKVKGLIVDVRGNPGGYLHSVAGVLSTLQKPGTVLAFMEDRAGVLEP